MTLIRRYGDGKRDFSWADLRAADLSQAQLPTIDLSRANLAGANLAGADLRQANLFKANLTGTNLVGADLSGANLRRADLTAARFDPEQLATADTRGAVGLAAAAMPEPTAVSPNAPIPPAFATDGKVPDPVAFPAAVASPAIALARRETVISLAILGIGHLFYGIVLGAAQVAAGWWPLVWLPVGLGLWQEELIWFVPVLGAIAVVVALELSAAVLLFFLPVALGLGVAFALCGSILGWSWGQSLKTTVWFGGLAFLAMHSAIWLFDGSNAYSGGGIVLNLQTFPVALLLGLGLLAVARGALAYTQLAELRYTPARQWLYLGGSAAVGLLTGVVVSR
ncbi:pentapeptide repeat-containing protein [Nodosilinea sp. PGN35]|uniref:pentapeptide repeat-containing protein n=1 Tax=Nodosilinea sp. PGN35 TaxID=3020489 RepID=UPI0023B2ABBB|nr:pentapeptide repeat-containing protein [Nodosilinea sp. TSF1-S3]MDF0365067.1 pentapeptide repeat-containing protein [Nodosilinea sp. TSF1-S3]